MAPVAPLERRYGEPSSKHLLDLPREIDILASQTALVVGCQRQTKGPVANIDVRMMIGRLGHLRDAVHDRDGCGEARELHGPYDLVPVTLPARKLRQRAIDLVIGESRHWYRSLPCPVPLSSSLAHGLMRSGCDARVDASGLFSLSCLAPITSVLSSSSCVGASLPPDLPANPSGDAELAVLVTIQDQPGVLHDLTGVISAHAANIVYVDITNRQAGSAVVHFELQSVEAPEQLLEDLHALPTVREIARVESFARVYGKRIIVVGGGAQVGQVAVGAISEADRHNIRGERISVDTIPLVGEAELAAAVRGVARLPRARVLVLAGSIMGGEITRAVREVRERGIIVISLNMAGSVPSAADLVVTDPVQAGVMAAMAIADTARFDIALQRGRRY